MFVHNLTGNGRDNGNKSLGGSHQSSGRFIHLFLRNIQAVQDFLCIFQSFCEGSPGFGSVILFKLAFGGLDRLLQFTLLDVADLDDQVVQNEVLIAAEVFRTIASIHKFFQVWRCAGGINTKPALAGFVAGQGEGEFLRLADCLRYRHQGSAAFELADAIGNRIGIGAAQLILKADIIGNAGFKVEVLRDRLIDHGILGTQAVDLHRPIAFQHVVHSLICKARLGVLVMAFGEMDTVVGDSARAGNNKGINTLHVVFKIIFKARDGAVFVHFLDHIHRGFHNTDIVEESVAIPRRTAEGQGQFAALRSGKENKHVLEVAGAVFRIATVVVLVRRNQILYDGTVRKIGRKDFVAGLNRHRSRGVAAVVYADIKSVLFASLKADDRLRHGNFAIQLEHRVLAGIVSQFRSTFARLGPVIQIAAVEAGILNMHTGAPFNLFRLLFALIYNIRSFRFGGQGDPTVVYVDKRFFGFAGIGELIDNNVL